MEEKETMIKEETATPQLEYASIWIRMGAGLIDGIILWIGTFVTHVGVLFTLGGKFIPILDIIDIVLIFAYYIVLQTSNRQATVGMKVCKIKLTTLEGEKTTKMQVFGRELAGILSWVFLIGYIMIAFTEKKQGLHDKLAGTLVIHNRQ